MTLILVFVLSLTMCWYELIAGGEVRDVLILLFTIVVGICH